MSDGRYCVRVEAIDFEGETSEDLFVYAFSSELERDAALLSARSMLRNFSENRSFEEYIALCQMQDSYNKASSDLAGAQYARGGNILLELDRIIRKYMTPNKCEPRTEMGGTDEV